MDINKIRNDFPMLKNNLKMQGHNLIYFDNAATSLKPNCVLNAIKEYYETYTSNSHRGDYDLEYKVDVKIDETRNSVAKLINANKDEIVFTSGTTMSLNMIAMAYALKHLKKGDEILLSEVEHASNILPWFKVKEITGCDIKYIPLDKYGKVTTDNLLKVISKNTKIVSLAHISNVIGEEINAKEIAKIVHSFGAKFVLDGAQSVPHKKVDVKDLDCDFLAFSAHKMLGPTGVGVLYAKKELLEDMDTYIVGGGMNETFKKDFSVIPHKAPTKFEGGTLNIEGIIAFNEAIKYLLNLGLDNIEKIEKELKKYAISKLKELDNVIIYNEHAESGIITFNIKGVFAQDAATYFNSKGIALRSGQHCAKILNDHLGTIATLRASLYFYNTKEEIDEFVETCKHGGDFLNAYF